MCLMLKAGEVSREVRAIESNFYNWLKMSHLTYCEFLEQRHMVDFKVLHEKDRHYNVITIGSMQNGRFTRIGEPFIYEEGDVNAFGDLALLLLYIAERLDEANKRNADFKKKEYFYGIVKPSLQSMEDYKKMKNVII